MFRLHLQTPISTIYTSSCCMPARSGKEHQPLAFQMAGPSQAKTGSDQPGTALEQLRKVVENLQRKSMPYSKGKLN